MLVIRCMREGKHGSFRGGVGRGSGEAHSVSDLKIKNRCRGRVGKIAQLAKVSELPEVIRVMMILGRFLEVQIG